MREALEMVAIVLFVVFILVAMGFGIGALFGATKLGFCLLSGSCG